MDVLTLLGVVLLIGFLAGMLAGNWAKEKDRQNAES